MLLVNTYIAPSDIHGIGLFSAEDIKKGEPVWKYHQNTTQIFWKKQFLSICKAMPLSAILELINYSYLKDGNVYHLNDRAKFINHSTSPNVAFKDSKTEVAIQDIKKGEEITENYFLSYDKNDFYNWDFKEVSKSKEKIILFIKNQFLMEKTPVRNFSF